MRLMVLTTQFPFGDLGEVFFETELRKLAESFEVVHLLPLKGGQLNRQLPVNVELWKPLALHGKWSHVRGLLRWSAWWKLLVLLRDCYRDVGRIRREHIINGMAAVCWQSAFERHRQYNDFLHSGKVNVVYAYWAHFPALGVPSAKAANVRTCVRYHSVDLYVEREANQGYIPYRDQVRGAADLNVFISQHGHDYFTARSASVTPGRCVINRLGSPDFMSARCDRPVSTVGAPIVIASASRIVDVKRVHLIARLAKELAKYQSVEWHHFGGGNCPILQREIGSELPKTLRIQMWGTVPPATIFEFYRTNVVTFFVNLSAFEGVPVSIMEALCADIPVIASDVGATSEAVIDGQSGLLVGPDECERSDTLAKKVLDALQPGGVLRSTTPRRVWEKLYDADANAAEMVAHLRKLAEA